MDINPELEAIRQREESSYERVVHDTPTGEGYHEMTGWTITGVFQNTEVPMIVVINDDGLRRVPLDRVQYTERREPEDG